LFEERLAANYSVSILAQVDEPHFDATIYYAHL